MVKISYSPISELVVHEVVKVGLDDLMRERITPAGTMPLYWCNGVIFSFSSVPLNEKVMDDYMQGRIHWMEVHFAEMDKYMEVVELNDEHYNGAMKVRVIDTSRSPLHIEFVKWLKKNGKPSASKNA
ncbi:MAG: hypothetical protein M1125_02880 [Candidatus Marsarchaeota archaeon]|nr:hypothetical protein [Candidatus Marsarchaeota archaeon]